jgi:apolipoprotein D and lipocalin family protein
MDLGAVQKLRNDFACTTTGNIVAETSVWPILKGSALAYHCCESSLEAYMATESEKALWWIGLGASIMVAGAAVAFGTDGNGEKSARPLRTVDKVDLNRYMGSWYEIARNPNPFEGDCAGNTTAHYTMHGDGRIEVVNACRTSSGKKKIVRGVAKVVDPVSKAKLKVQYQWPFAGDYWILLLNAFYEYAVVGEPSRKYLWILSRSSKLDKGTYRGILERIEELGYDTSRLLLTQQSEETLKERHAHEAEREEQITGAKKAKAATAR